MPNVFSRFVGVFATALLAVIAFHIGAIPSFEEPPERFNTIGQTPMTNVPDTMPDESTLDTELAIESNETREDSPRDRQIEATTPSESGEEIPLSPSTTTLQPEHATSEPTVARLESPYPFPPQSLETVNIAARAALVNILCQSTGGSLNPISGSGVIIDPRGVILTNAHVAQFVLLASRLEVGLTCVARTGSPAKSRWNVQVLYMPQAWVDAHAADIRAVRPTGTGEHDYALLVITGNNGATPLPPSFPHLPYDTRETIGFVGDTVLLASYPAEFSGGLTTQNDLYASSAITSIRELFTFDEYTVDLLSLGSVILAQSGSSGGAAVNEWGRLIGIITTTSDGKTTAERDLRAVTLSYINEAISRGTGADLAETLSGDLTAKSAAFMASTGARLAETILNELR